MAARRGLNNAERLALNAVSVTAAGFIKNIPLYLYDVVLSKRNATASALAILADTTASADTVTDAIITVTLPSTSNATGGGGDNTLHLHFSPPVYVAQGLDWDVTNTADVSVTYLPAS